MAAADDSFDQVCWYFVMYHLVAKVKSIDFSVDNEHIYCNIVCLYVEDADIQEQRVS